MVRKFNRWIAPLIVAWVTALFARVLIAQPYINEIYFEPPSGLNLTAEYIELRGNPSASLANHYLIS